MKIRKDDMLLLRGPLLALGVAMLVAAALTIGTRQYRLALQREVASAQRNLNAANAQLTNARNQEVHFTRNTQMYQVLVKKGLFAGERRLEWIDAVSALRERHELFNIDYDISSQGALRTPDAPAGALASKVEMRIQALHEHDLINFLNDLKAQAPGVFVLDFCSIKHEVSTSEKLGPNITAYCTLQWITVKEKNA